jgi:uncharacterized protein
MNQDLVKIIGTQFVYDSRTGRSYTAGRYVLEALRQVLSLSHPPIPVEDSEKLEEAKEIVRKKHAHGLFANKPLRGYQLPDIEQITNPQLYEISLVVTERCNLRCSYCAYTCSSASTQFRTHRSVDMPIETANLALNFFYGHASTDTSVAFYGGEPLLNFMLIKHVVNEIKRNMPDWNGIFTITTNFTKYSQEIGDFLAENNFLLMVSLDGPEQIHDRYRKTVSGKKTFKTIITNLIDLKERHPQYFANFVINNAVLTPPLDLNAVETFFSGETSTSPLKFLLSRFALASTSNPDFYPSVRCDPSSEAEKVEEYGLSKLCSCKDPEEIFSSPLLINFCLQRIRDIANPYAADEEGLRPFKSCIPGHKIMVDADGSLSICDKCETLKIGHIQSGRDMKRIERIILQWQETLGDDCLHCWASGFCRACYLAAWDGEKFNREQLVRYCDTFRRRAEKWLEVYLTLKNRNPHFFDTLDEIDKRLA